MWSLFHSFWENLSNRRTGSLWNSGKMNSSEGWERREAEAGRRVSNCNYSGRMIRVGPGRFQGETFLRLWWLTSWVGGQGGGLQGCVTKHSERKNIKQTFWLNMVYANVLFFHRSCRKVPPLLYFLSMNISPLSLLQDWVKDMIKMGLDSRNKWWRLRTGKVLKLRALKDLNFNQFWRPKRKQFEFSFRNAILTETLLQTGQAYLNVLGSLRKCLPLRLTFDCVVSFMWI